MIKIGDRIQLHGPDFSRGYWWRAWGGHGSDEYGNCSFYVQLPLVGGVVWFYGSHLQREVEMPEPGECEWVDRKYYT